jgi:hypothetical protein
VTYLPKSRNCVNTRQTAMQKNANIFIFLLKEIWLLPESIVTLQRIWQNVQIIQ